MTAWEKLQAQRRSGVLREEKPGHTSARGLTAPRGDSNSLCDCGEAYRKHPYDLTEISWIDGLPYLRELCDGTLVKL